MQATSKRRFVRLAVVAGAALSHVPYALWAVYVLVVKCFASGDWLFSPLCAYLLFRVVTASLALLGLGFVAVALKRRTVSKAILPAMVVCIVGSLILLEIGVLWARQTERLLDGLPEFATSMAVILAALAFGCRWPYAKYAARTIILVLIGLYGFRHGGLLGVIDANVLSWQALVAYASRASELLSLTLPLVLLDLLSNTSVPLNQPET